MSIKITGLDIQSVLYVVKHMRKADWQEVINSLPHAYCTVDRIAMVVAQRGGVGFVIHYDETPVCVVEVVEKHEGCWSCGLFATEQFALVWRSTIKAINEICKQLLLSHGARYCEAHASADNVDAHRLLEWIGFKKSSEVLKGYGSYGADFILFTLVKEELNHVFRR